MGSTLDNYWFPKLLWDGTKGGVDTLWIKVTPLVIKGYKASARQKSGFEIARALNPYHFLAPSDWTRSITHTWRPLESMIGNMLNEAAETGNAAASIATAAQGAATAVGGGSFFDKITETVKSILPGTGTPITSALNTLTKDAEMNANLFSKYDAPVQWNSSTPLSINFKFIFADITGNNFNDVILPIQTLSFFSSASRGNSDDSGGPGTSDLLNFKPPFVFDVMPVNGLGEPLDFLFHFERAYIGSINTQFSGPYRNGYPSYATCDISFNDARPLYKDSFKGMQDVSSIYDKLSKGEGDSDSIINLASSPVSGDVFNKNARGTGVVSVTVDGQDPVSISSVDKNSINTSSILTSVKKRAESNITGIINKTIPKIG